MKNKSAFSKFLILMLLCLSIVSFGLFTACQKPKGEDPGDDPGEGGGESEMHVVIDDAYLCKSTGRFMASQTAGGDLLPVTFDNLQEGETVLFNQQENVTIDKTLIKSLDATKTHEILLTKADGKTITYNAKVAEKVIVRFANNDQYANKSVYGAGLSAAEDYLVDFNVTATSGTKVGKSVFYFTNNVSTTVVPMRWPTSTISGLYVLANNITYSNEDAAKRNIYITNDSSNTSHPQTWEVDTTFESIEGKREVPYFVPREGYGFVGTFDGRGKVIDTNQRYTSIGLLPPAYGATIKNLAMINVNTFTYTSESPLVCSAKNTTFENIYVEYEDVRFYQGDANKPMLTSFDTCTLKNFVVDCDLLNIERSLTFGKVINTDDNSGYGQGRETTGVFSFVDFCDINSAGTAVINPHSYTNTPAGDAFVGTTAQNVYAVGSTPLYINQEMDLHKDGYAYKPSMRATYFVNEMYKYKSGNQMVLCDQNTFYDETVFWDTEYETRNNSLVKIVQHAKRQRYGVEIFIKLSLDEDIYKFRFINKEGFYDAKDAIDMKAQVLKNKNEGKEFDASYWTVAKDGKVAWKGL